MDLLADHVFLSRLQFALTTMFHIIWPPLTIGLSLFLVYLEAMWLKTGDPAYRRHFDFWVKFFLLGFAVGVVSGIPLEFEFGTNFGPFSRAVGNFFGQVLGFEGTMAFMLEAAFLWIMAFGWKRVGRKMHFFATCMVALGSSLSSFWILVANSWMQTPAGGQMEDGVFVVKDWWAAVFNPDLWHGFAHMYVACVVVAAFAVGGVSAWYLLRGVEREFFIRSFKIAIVAGLASSVLQAYVGDSAGQAIGRFQPAKVAAIESHWDTNKPGQGAAWNMLAWPDPEQERNLFQIQIPYGLSLLITHSLTGTVPGLKEFPKNNRPPIVIIFYSFRAMVGIGFALIALAGVTVWGWWKRDWLARDGTGPAKLLVRAWMLAGPAALLAVELGWITREIGRQPWVVYSLIRTDEAASPLPAASVGFTLLAFLAVYSLLLLIFAFFALRLLKKGPPPARAAGHDPA